MYSIHINFKNELLLKSHNVKVRHRFKQCGKKQCMIWENHKGILTQKKSRQPFYFDESTQLLFVDTSYPKKKLIRINYTRMYSTIA